MKNETIQALLEGREENHQLPFLWLHGEDEATLRQMMAVIHGASCGAVCLESRTHPDFCGPQWWHDVDIILEEAKARGMRVWILDDKHYPSGMANGALLQAPEELCRQNIFCNRLTLGQEAGPVALSLRQAGLLEGPGPTQGDIRQGFLPGGPARRVDPAGNDWGKNSHQHDQQRENGKNAEGFMILHKSFEFHFPLPPSFILGSTKL